MPTPAPLADLFRQLDQHLDAAVRAHGAWSYALLFLLAFAEAALIFTPYLPGNSLLFVAGILAARGLVRVPAIITLLSVASVAGDIVNYWIGRYLAGRAVERGWRVMRPETLERIRAYYARYGGVTLIVARYIPFVGTPATFVAGLGRMAYGRFVAYAAVLGTTWVSVFVLAGYLFGHVPVVRDHVLLITFAAVAVLLLSLAVRFGWNRALRREGC